MKRFVLFISAILLSFAARAQSVTYTCRYWFDQNDAQTVITTFSEGTWQAELDVGTLSNGLHTLHVQAVDTSAAWCPPLSYMFFKSTSGESLLDSVDMGNLTYHCWFDQDHAHQQTGALGSGGFLFDVDGLGKGLHSIHVMLEGSDFTSSQSYMFFKFSDSEPLLDSVDMSNLTYHCWFDQDYAHQQTGTLANGSFLFDVSNLEEGPHSLNVMLEGSTLTASQSYMFVKIGQEDPLIEPIDMSHLVFHCWFDQDYENRVVDSVSNGAILLDLGNIADGLHTVHIMLEGEAVTSIESYMFVKMSQQNSLIEPIDMSNLTYQCWFDQDYEHRVTAPISNGIMLLDVDNMRDGLHSVHILLEGEALTSTLTYLFFKRPAPQDTDFGIAKWQYVLNGDLSHLHTTEFSPLIDTLDIVALLPVETWPVRSSCFHFHPNGDAPYLNAKNEVTFRFWSNDDRVLLESAFYVDYQVQQDIVANVFERNTTETFTAPRNNQIQWFKLEAMVGDSLAFVTDKACTMQLFAPSGEEVYAATASEAMVLGGCHARENGTYYLAVHDVTGSGETISVTYNWIYRYAVLAYDVHLVGNGGCSTITFQGNGFNSLLGAYLVNIQNDTISKLHIGHESNTTTTVTFNFYGVNLGVYDAVFEFCDETIRVNGALEVQEPVDIQLTSTVSYPSSFMVGTTCTYTYTITNNGNMTGYVVPIRMYISTPTKDAISHLEFDGLDLPSIIDGMDMDSISESDRIWLQEWAEEMGEDHCFLQIPAIDEQTGDSVFVRSNYFFLTFAPFETKTLTLKIKAYETLNVWMIIPSESYPSFVLSPEGDYRREGTESSYCCVREQIQCTIDLVCSTAAAESFFLGIFGKYGEALSSAFGVARCICGELSELHENLSYAICDEPDVNPFERFTNWRKCVSVASTVVSCVSSCVGPGRAKNVLKVLGSGLKGFNFANLFYTEASVACGKKWAEIDSNCPPDPDGKGGKSSAVAGADPNDIRGYLSESGSHYMRQEIQNIHYEIEFENDTTLATAAAHTIIVRDTLDATRFDLNSLAAHSITIGNKRLDLNGEQNFARTLDMRPELYVIAQIEQDYDPETGIVVWTIQSLDPVTMEPTIDPYQGVLPINFYGDGVGFIDYSVNLKQAFADGTAVSNRAGIIFDQNEVIMTPTWTNIVDAVKPTSHIENVTVEADSLNFSFVSSDSRSGVWYHNLYYRNVSTEQEWQVRKAQIFEDSFMLPIDSLRTTEYLVMAVDSAGNVEDKEMVAEAIIEANPSLIHFIVSGDWSDASNWANGVMPGVNDKAFIDAHCTLDGDAEVTSLIVSAGQSLTIPYGQTLTVTDSLTNTGMTGLVIEDGGQLVHANVGSQGLVQKEITPYTNNNNNWYLIASPIAGQIETGAVADLLRNDYDLYYYDEPTQYWMNQENASNNFTELVNGKGYLYANEGEVTLGFAGELQNGFVTVNVPLSYTGGIQFDGFNLVGNPFVHNVTSYDAVNVAEGCYRMNDAKDDLVVSEISGSYPLKPAEGFFVKATGEGASITFNPQREHLAPDGSIRVELFENNLLIDRLIVKTDEKQSLEKLSLNVGRTKLFAQGKNQEWAVVPCEGNEQPVNFKAARNGQYTITVNANGMELNYLHIIDNLTGVDIDLLVEPSYTFEAKTSDYASRFLLVFSVYGDADKFAFISNGNIVIVGVEDDAVLQIVDVTGHILVSRKGDEMRRVSTSGMAKGVYVLHLINGDNVKTQKIVID